eukprot:Gb_23869 [translate_table: standard]
MKRRRGQVKGQGFDRVANSSSLMHPWIIEEHRAKVEKLVEPPIEAARTVNMVKLAYCEKVAETHQELIALRRSLEAVEAENQRIKEMEEKNREEANGAMEERGIQKNKQFEEEVGKMRKYPKGRVNKYTIGGSMNEPKEVKEVVQGDGIEEDVDVLKEHM